MDNRHYYYFEILAISAIVGVLAFVLDTFILQPAELKAEAKIKKSKIILVVIMAIISIVIATVILTGYPNFFVSWRRDSFAGFYAAIIFVAIMGEGILLFTLDAASVQKNVEEERKKYENRIRWVSILLYFSFVQMQLWSTIQLFIYYQNDGYKYIHALTDIIVFSIVEILLSALIFLLYLKKSRVCAVLISIWAVYEIWLIRGYMDRNMYVFVFAFLSVAASYLTFRYHKVEKNG